MEAVKVQGFTDKKIKRIIPIYGGIWYILFGDIKEMHKKYNFEGPPADIVFEALTFKYNHDYYTAFESVTPGIIAHEAKHLVNQIYIDNNIQPDLFNDEPECYLLNWIVDRIHESKRTFC